MPQKTVRNITECSIPDDPERSIYRFIIVAAKRARQLQSGARPALPTSSKKPTAIAMEEVRRGLVEAAAFRNRNESLQAEKVGTQRHVSYSRTCAHVLSKRPTDHAT